MKTLLKYLNDVISENGFPYCIIKEIKNDHWWQILIGYYGMEFIYNKLTHSVQNKNFKWEDNYFHYDSEQMQFFSYNSEQELKDKLHFDEQDFNEWLTYKNK